MIRWDFYSHYRCWEKMKWNCPYYVNMHCAFQTNCLILPQPPPLVDWCLFPALIKKPNLISTLYRYPKKICSLHRIYFCLCLIGIPDLGPTQARKPFLPYFYLSMPLRKFGFFLNCIYWATFFFPSLPYSPLLYSPLLWFPHS